MAFPVPIASVLSGASIDQLGYWRRPTAKAEPLLVPETKRSGRYLYSWADIVALRSIVFLREEKSLPKIRRAVRQLRGFEAGQWVHLSQYTLARTSESIYVRRPDGEILDLERSPGAILDETLMADVLKPFESKGAVVPSLEHPRDHLDVDPDILDGFPVVSGSRVPFHLVASLAEDGADAAEIIEIYPSVDPSGIEDARSFARQVHLAA
jgi:uncharacterized protein (DUF433 family)/DNA-binding transcriptional MerR regulator